MLARIEEALTLVRTYVLRRYARLPYDRMSTAVGYHGGLRYVAFANACVVDLAFLERGSPVMTAAVILLRDAVPATVGWRDAHERRQLPTPSASPPPTPGARPRTPPSPARPPT